MKFELPRDRVARIRRGAVVGAAAACTALAFGVAPASAVTTNLTDVEINEVESNGDAVNGDWIELYNTGLAINDEVDLSGVILSDSDNSHRFVIPARTYLGVNEWAAFRVDDPAVSGNFGLGAADSARLFPANTVDLSAVSPTDTYSWTAHAATTYGARPEGSSTFSTTAAGTFGDANDFGLPPVGNITGVRLNEVESNGDATNGDWVELYNTTGSAINIDGAIITDSDPAHQFVVPATTPNLPAGGYVAFRLDDPLVTGNFGLGSSDAVRLYAPNDITLRTVVDQYSWSAHATVTYGRNVAGAGSWVQTTVSTFAAVNQFRAITAPDLTGVVINEVESHGDDRNGDWIELKNTTGSSVTLDDAILSDSNNSNVFRIPAATPDLAAGAVAAFRVDDPALGSAQFGLGDSDAARLFRADAVDLARAAVVSDELWGTHALQTYGLDGSGVFRATNKSTYAAANDFTSTVTPDISYVVLNEVVTTGDAVNGDWVELLNTSGSTIDISGAIIADSTNTNTYTIPASTLLAAGRTFVLRTATGGFGFDGNDAVRLFRAGATVGTSIPVDHHEWSEHAVGSFARQSAGLGDWIVDATPSYNAAN
ncbi:lamin tail domain-containing protein [Conexibacter stalactiti]|uniref:Lamin tail domain-containing protein n=1 Tax=Conexibacter stalactiti TaxID=1940611 RepID=A0ABU4HK61_9ACTN|nr:lamin tail domain-containing protein [Conexibacter stalactiti]MDW5593701.1 lamin tail domain-containing protein [Conexibacter stalactiti]MEC5034342.1 lamin tail domain-containing protein [Conexibacter stalactiti]